MEVQQLVDYRAFNLEQTEADKLLSRFQFLLEEISKYEIALNSINVADENDLQSMEEARRLRLAAVKVRTNTDKIHEELKAESLRKGKFIDGIKNQIYFLIKPIEEKAKEKEETQKRFLENIAQEVYNLRSKELDNLNYPYQHLDIKNMPDEVYENTFHEAQELFNLKERLKKEKEQEQIDLALKLKQEREEKELIRVRLLELNSLGLTMLPEITEDDLKKSEDYFIDLKLRLIENKKRSDKKIEDEKKEQEKQKEKLRLENEQKEKENKKLQDQLAKQKEQAAKEKAESDRKLKEQQDKLDKEREEYERKEINFQAKLEAQEKQKELPKKKSERLGAMILRIRNCNTLPSNPTINESEFYNDIILICEKYENK